MNQSKTTSLPNSHSGVGMEFLTAFDRRAFYGHEADGSAALDYRSGSQTQCHDTDVAECYPAPGGSAP
jgi:hypothetical protein